MSTQAAPVHKDLDAMEVELWQAYGEDIDSAVIQPAIDELRLARSVIKQAIGHTYDGWYKCPCCHQSGTEGHDLHHEQGCALDAYLAWRDAQGREA